MILFSLKIPTSCDLKQLIQFSVEVFCTLHMFVDTLALFKKREAKKGCLFSYVNIKRPTHKVGQVYTKIDIKPSGLTKERLAFMKTQMRLLYDDK